MTNGRSTFRKTTVFLLGSAFLLSGCENGFTLQDAFDKRPTGRNETPAVPRPKPDSRGLITYPNYQVIVARSGDTMNDVAGRIGLSGAALAKYNGLDPEYRPRPGEVLALPKGVVKPIKATSEQAAKGGNLEEIASSAIGRAGAGAKARVQSGTEPIRHVVETGETAYSIARLYKVSVKSLASWNGLDKDLSVRPGQRLLIPVVADGTPKEQVAAAAVPAPGAGSITPIPPSAIEPLPDKVEEVAIPESPNLGETRTNAPTKTARMVKPVPGKVLRGYSNKPGGNEGLDLAAQKGASVKAADSGEVALVSSAGGKTKIVLIRHPDNLYTVYSNVTDVSVKKGQSIQRGQSLGKVAGGNPGFLHFEIRRGTESVDPSPYL